MTFIGGTSFIVPKKVGKIAVKTAIDSCFWPLKIKKKST
jgi:hypothetical protein